MKIAYQWLKKYIPIEISPQEITNQITLSGLEVEKIEKYETIPGNLEGVIIAQVIECEKHPNADKLKKCKVHTGKEVLDVVCGAPNVAVNQKVLFATVGTTLYPLRGDPITIQAAKIRGEMSYGMICAEDELGLGKNHDGIMVLPENAPVGIPAKEYFQLHEDYILEIGLTPNRTDAMSHFGVARELSAIYKIPTYFPSEEVITHIDCPVRISVEVSELCPLYAGLTILNLKVQDSPKWLKNLLLSVGQKPINNVVDVTNYVMLGLGQPLHAFDLSKIYQNHVIVRKSYEKEELVTLDNQKHILTGHELVIANPKEAMCIAGVMGGLETSVNQDTSSIFLEAAYFLPEQVRLSAQKTGIHTESSYRFERGIDPNKVIDCLKYAAYLIQQIAGGEVSKVVFQGQTEFEPYVIPFNYQKANSLIGYPIHKDTYHQVFQALDFQLQKMNEDNIKLLVPRYRHDVTRFQDVIEEFLRIYGLNNIPSADTIKIPLNTPKIFSDYEILWNIGNHLAGQGWNEIQTNSLVPKKFSNERTVKILNKLSEQNADLRQTLLWGGLQAIQFNMNRQNPNLKFFEWGKVYELVDNQPTERMNLALWLTGNRFPENWLNPTQKSSLYEIQSVFNEILNKFMVPYTFHVLDNTEYFEQGLAYVNSSKILAQLGIVKPSLLKFFDIKQNVYFGWIEWNEILPWALKSFKPYQPVPKYPSVRRDISLFVPPNVTYQMLENNIRKVNPRLIHEINLFDVFEDSKNNQISYAISILFLDENKTLTDEMVEDNMQKIFKNLEKIEGIIIRK